MIDARFGHLLSAGEKATLRSATQALSGLFDPSGAPPEGTPQEPPDEEAPAPAGGDEEKPDEGTPPPAPGDSGTGDLQLVVITSLTSVFDPRKRDLIVTIEGPVTRSQTKEKVASATPVRVDFLGIPEGTYEVTATWGSKGTVKTVQVQGTTIEFELIIP